MKDATSAIFILCIAHEKKARTVREGAVQVILSKIIMDRVLVDEFFGSIGTSLQPVKGCCSIGKSRRCPFSLWVF